MAIFYIPRKKVFKIGGVLKTLYYAIPKALQKKGVTQNQLANELAERSSLSSGDVLSVLEQLPKRIAGHLKDGRTITIDGLGTFYIAISSDGAETPEECRPEKIRSYRVCFRADDRMKGELSGCSFERIGKKIGKEEK